MINSRFRPTLSVIIGVRNGAQHIGGCLERIYAQGLDPQTFEVIIADGLSEDGTRDAIEGFVRSHQITNLQVIPNPRLTLAAAFNVALPKVRGDYLAKVDAQSRIGPNYFRALMDALERHPEVAVVGGRFEPCGDTRDSRAWAHVFSDPWLVGPAAYRYADKEQYIDTVYLGMYRVSVVQQVGQFDERLLRSEDTDFNYRIRQLGWKFLLVPSVSAEYYVRRNYREAFRQFHGYAYYRYAFNDKYDLPLTIRQKGPLAIGFATVASAATIIWTWPITLALFLGYTIISGWRAWTTTSGGLRDRARVFLVYPVVHLAYIKGNIDYVLKRNRSQKV